MSTTLERQLLKIAYAAGFIGVVQFLFITTWLMQMYPGGNIADRASIGYDFFMNFMSDLGRTNAFRRGPNPTASIYALSLMTAGGATIVFFSALGHYLFYASRNYWAIPMVLLAFVAGGGYIGIAVNPINEGYGIHRLFVQWSFIGFFWMSVFCAIAIRRSPVFPDRYARYLWLFLLLLGVQIVIMMFGPRSWSSSWALALQVTAQKIVVYAEILMTLLLCTGAMGALRKAEASW